jgi:hypothetical protein
MPPEQLKGRIGLRLHPLRAGALVPAQAGQEVFEADGLKTGATAVSASR